MDCQAARRASRGCVDVVRGAVEDEDGRSGSRFERRVSWRPGADGAPLFDDVLVLEVGWLEGGAMRKD